MIYRLSLALCVLFTPAIAGASEARRLGGAADADISLVRVFLALLFCLLIAIFAVFFIRQRYGGNGSASFLVRMRPSSARIRMIESRRIGPQSDVAIVVADDREYALLLSPGGPLLLRERPVELETDNGE